MYVIEFHKKQFKIKIKNLNLDLILKLWHSTDFYFLLSGQHREIGMPVLYFAQKVVSTLNLKGSPGKKTKTKNLLLKRASHDFQINQQGPSHEKKNSK